MATLHGPGHWGWVAKDAPVSALVYRGAFGGFVATGFVEAVLLNASVVARSLLLSALSLSAAAWVIVGQADILSSHPTARLCVRAVALIVMLGSFGALADDSFIFRFWPFAVAIGIELYLTLSSIGIDETGAGLFRRASLSAANVAVIAVVVGFRLFESAGMNTRTAVTLYLGIVGGASIAIAMFEVMRRISRSQNEALELAKATGRIDGLGARTAWLHDTAISDLKRVRASSRRGDADYLINEIERIEDDLRDDYLNLQITEANEIDLGALMWRYARKFRTGGRQIVLPSSDVNRTVVSGVTAERFKRFLDVTVQNAVDAGASQVSIVVVPEPSGFGIAVEDDAGGFDPDLTHAGGSLTRLRRDFDWQISVESTPLGSNVSTHIEGQP